MFRIQRLFHTVQRVHQRVTVTVNVDSQKKHQLFCTRVVDPIQLYKKSTSDPSLESYYSDGYRHMYTFITTTEEDAQVLQQKMENVLKEL